MTLRVLNTVTFLPPKIYPSLLLPEVAIFACQSVGWNCGAALMSFSALGKSSFEIFLGIHLEGKVTSELIIHVTFPQLYLTESGQESRICSRVCPVN